MNAGLREGLNRGQSNGLAERQREKTLPALAAQNEETENLQKKSILLDLSSAVTIVGVDVTITNKIPLKPVACVSVVPFNELSPRDSPCELFHSFPHVLTDVS